MNRLDWREQRDAVAALLHDAGAAGLTSADVALQLGVDHARAERLLAELVSRDGAELLMPSDPDQETTPLRYRSTLRFAPPPAARAALSALQSGEEAPGARARHRALVWLAFGVVVVAAMVALLVATTRGGARTAAPADTPASPDRAPPNVAEPAPEVPLPTALERAAAVRLAAREREHLLRERATLARADAALDEAAIECALGAEWPCYHEGRLVSAAQLAEERAWVRAALEAVGRALAE